MAAKTTAKNAKPPTAKRFCSLPHKKPRVLDSSIGSKRARLILLNSNKWVNGTTLHYYFFNKKTDGAEVELEDGSTEFRTWVGTEAQMDVVRKAFRIWAKTGISLKFKEVKNRKDAEIRIAFMKGDGSWSYIGRDILEEDDDPRTMNFGWNIAIPDHHDGIDTAIHEIGHTIGFPHEHQNPFAGIVWNKPAVYESLAAPPNEWSKEETDDNIINKLSKKEVNGSTWDPDSIMHYPFEKGLIKKPVEFANKDLEPAGGLSPQDIQYALQFYPPKNPKKDIRVFELIAQAIDVKNCEQQNYIFKPAATKTYSIQTVGELDTVMVLSEKLTGGEAKFVAGDDNSGTTNNALISAKLSKEKTYIIKLKVFFKKPNAKTALMIA